MKVKSWHLGCLVILVAAALYFLMNTREGLDNSSTPPTAVPPAVGSPPLPPPVLPPSSSTSGTDTLKPSLSPMPPGPTGTAGGASMTLPSVPVPITPPSTTTPGAPTYSLTCTAAPVSGMVGSAAPMPETPPAWNVTQPPSGWNSKNGYTTTGN